MLMRSTRTALVAFAAALALPAWSFAQQTFDSPQAASDALIQAARSNDTAQMRAIFGSQGQQILTSGNPSQDQAERAEFAKLAAEQHNVEMDSRNPNRALLTVGPEDWPFPVPLVRTNGKWGFDASSGVVEMRVRRVGANELDAIEICAGYVQAQKAYAERGSTPTEYARHVLSSPGKQDGLYWEGTPAPLVPKQFAEAVWNAQQHGKAYHGYYFSVLVAQGPDAPGGQHSYLMKDRLAGGFGLVAWPAEYGVTGIHTFIVNQDGAIYEKDLVPQQGKTGPPISTYNPGRSWTLVDE